jgi:hypothetical protein
MKENRSQRFKEIEIDEENQERERVRERGREGASGR